MSKYTIKKIEVGLYDYDTIFISKDKTEFQVPIKKGLLKGTEKEIEIEFLDRPIDN